MSPLTSSARTHQPVRTTTPCTTITRVRVTGIIFHTCDPSSRQAGRIPCLGTFLVIMPGDAYLSPPPTDRENGVPLIPHHCTLGGDVVVVVGVVVVVVGVVVVVVVVVVIVVVVVVIVGVVVVVVVVR